MSDEVEVLVNVRTNKVGSGVEETVTFDRDDWESMDDLEREKCLFETVCQMIEWDWTES